MRRHSLAALRHFTWLLARETRNRAVRMAGRVRSPRYAAALLLGLVYFAWVFIWIPMENRAAAGPGPGSVPLLLELGAPLLLLVLVGAWWLAGGYERALAFNPAEVQLLFPAPLERRDLLHLRLLRSQQAVLATAVLFSLFIDMGPLPWPLKVVTIWLVVSTLHLHQIASSLVRVSAARGGAGLRRAWLPLALFLGAAAALAWTFWTAVPLLRAAETGEALEAAFRETLGRPVPRALLLPPRLVLGPALAPDLATWLRALPAAVGLLLLHYLWVVRSDAAFEEAAAEAGRKRAEAMAALRSGRSLWSVERKGRLSRPWVSLAPTGTPEVALLWKGFLDFTRAIRPAVVALVVGGAVTVFGLVALLERSVEAGAGAVAIVGLMVAAFLTVMGPLAFRVDLRKDLLRIGTLRSYPLRGVGVVAAEAGASTAALFVTQLSMVAVTLPFLPFAGLDRGELPWVLAAGALGLVIVPAVDALIMTIQNGLALLFPGWIHIGSEQPGGVEFMGQFLLTILITALLLAVAMAGPLFMAFHVTVVLAPALGAWVALPATGAVLLGIGAELLLLVTWLGDVYETMDPAGAGLLD